MLTIPDDALSKLPGPTRERLAADNIIAALSRGLVLYTKSDQPRKGKTPSSVKTTIDSAVLDVVIDSVAPVGSRFAADFVESFPARRLEKYADSLLLGASDCRAWKIKAFLIASFPGHIKDTKPSRFGHEETEWPETLPGRKWRSCIGACVDAVLSSLEREDQFAYTRDVLRELDAARPGDGRRRQLYALQRALERLVDQPDGAADRFSFASVHSDLVSRLRDMADHDPEELLKALELVQVVLDRKGGFMTQWSVESTLSAVSVVCTSTNARTALPCACKLVETLLKRHRVRLEGHYHIITTTLQCLLRALLVGPAEMPDTHTHAHAFTRLVTMLCSPTAGAVASRHHGHRPGDVVLDLATVSAKRFAGQYMYLVLMTYVEILLGAAGTGIGRQLRDALEPGWNALFDVTSQETRKILNDALDEGGREVVREMWKRYTVFGKWSGV